MGQVMTPLVLIPGMMCDARLWGALPERLPCPVIHFIPKSADNMAELAAQCLATAPPRFALSGLSMGGIVAMEVLRQAPDRIERLALLDTNPLAERPEVQARRGPQIDRALAGHLLQVMRQDMMPHYLANPDDPRGLLDLCADMALGLGPQVFARQSIALRDRPDQTQTLGQYRGPALVLMGEGDRLCPRDRHDLMAGLMPQARLAIVAGAGHLPTLEQPDAILDEFTRWIGAPL